MRKVTVKEKVLLHLFDFSRHSEEYVVPLEVSQEGIASATGIRPTHVTQYVRPLIAEEYVEEKSSHVKGKARHRKVYFLTPKGRHLVAGLRDALLGEAFPFKRKSGETTETPLSEVFQEHRRGESLLSLLQEHAALGYISEEVEVIEGGHVDFTQEAPMVERFYGRRKELDDILQGVDRYPSVVVTGMAGMGKTTLGSKACDLMRAQRSLFWRQVRPWDTSRDLAFRLATFLKALGRVELYGYLSTPGEKELGRMEALLTADLAGLSSLLVLDDVHHASKDAEAFISILHHVGKAYRETAILFLSRYVPDFYSRRDVAIDEAVLEVPLRSLDLESSRRLLAESGVPEQHLELLVAAGGGNPLFYKLMASSGPGATPETSLGTLETYIAEEIEPGLSEIERACLETASLYQLPVPLDALQLEAGVRKRILIQLHRKGLLDRVNSDLFVLHDALRAYFREGVPPERVEGLVSRVVEWLRVKAAEVADSGDIQAAIAYIGNAVAVDSDAARLSSSLRLLGKLRRFAGDYPGAIEAYWAAIRKAEELKDQARLYADLARCHTAQANVKEAEQQIQVGLQLLSPKPSLEAAWLLMEKANLDFEKQNYEATREEVEKVTSWLPGLPKDPDLAGYLANLWGLIHLSDPNRADYALAHEAFQDAVNAFGAIGNNASLCLAYNNLSLAELELGRMEQAMAHLDKSAEIAEAIGNLPVRATALFTRARFLTLYYGDYEDAERLYHETYRLAKAANLRHMLAWHHWHFAELYRYQGRYIEARESLEYFLKASSDMLNLESRADCLSLMVRVCLQAGDEESATEYLEEVLAFGGEGSSEYVKRAVEWAQAAMEVSRGEVDVATEVYAKAVKRPVADFRGELLLDYGRLLASLGRDQDAIEILEEARGALETISMPLERRARDMLRSLHGEV